MARRHGRPFKKGQSGNPGGRPSMPPLLKEFRKVSYHEFLDCCQQYGGMTRDDLSLTVANPETTNFQLIVATMVGSAVNGDKDARRELLERLWGKVKEQKDDEKSLSNPFKLSYDPTFSDDEEE